MPLNPSPPDRDTWSEHAATWRLDLGVAKPQKRQFVNRLGRVVRPLGWGKRKDAGSTPSPLRLTFRFENCDLWTPSRDFAPCTINDTLKWLHIAARVNAGSHPGGDSVAVRYKLPLPFLLSVPLP